jgi:hypothetical protein
MKKICTLSLVFLTLGAFAQHRGKMQQALQELTPGQQATLQSKRMALALELDIPQQEAVQRLLESRFEASAQRRENHRRAEQDSSLTPEARYQRMEARLDRELAFRQDLKDILTEDQYAQWKTHQAGKRTHRRGHHGRRGMGHGLR